MGKKLFSNPALAVEGYGVQGSGAFIALTEWTNKVRSSCKTVKDFQSQWGLAKELEAIVMKFTGIAIGILLVILGNIMPKMRRNAMFGLRTKWSMSNDSVWQKSQRFGGIASVLCGLAMIVISAFVPGVWNLFVMTIIIIVWLILCVIASYRYYKADNTP